MTRFCFLSLVLLGTACGTDRLSYVPEAPAPPSEPTPPVVEAAPPEEEQETPTDETPPEEETPTEETPPEEEAPPEEPPPDDCEDTSDLVYVIDRNDEALYLFDPTTGTFTSVGALDCAEIFGGQPASMSVARDGHAYVRYSDQTLYAVNLESMECTETPYDGSFGSFGMGYATAHAATWQDQLYIANSHQLAKLDTNTWSFTPLGSLPSQSELTGNADGELWAILPLEQPAQLVHLDKTDAHVIDRIYLPSFPDPYGIDTFAFATWGGDFWLFVRSYGLGNSTDIYRVQQNGTMTLFSQDTGMDVVGAGVSTCAPGE